MEEEFLSLSKRRYQGEKQSLLDMLELKEREVEDLRVLIKEQEQKLRDLTAALDEERLLRGEELARFQIEIQKFQENFENERRVVSKEDELNRAIVKGLNEQILERQKELEKVYDENRRVLSGFKDQMLAKTAEIEEMKRREKELETKIVASDGAAKEEVQRLSKKIFELEDSLAKEKEAGSKLEDASKTALTSSTAALLEERSKLVSLQNRVTDLTQAVSKIEGEKRLAIENWERERKKWEELWERERRVWENQRLGFADWEGKYFKEKALWEKMIAEKEEKEIRLTRVFGNLISELSRAGKNWAFSKGADAPAGVSPEAPTARFDQDSAPESSSLAPIVEPSPPRGGEGDKEMDSAQRKERTHARILKHDRWIRLGFWLSAALLLVLAAAGGVRVAQWFFVTKKAVVFKEAASWDAPAQSPSGLAAMAGKSDLLWLADWKTGALLEVSALEPSRVLKRHEPKNSFFHPNSIAASSDGKYLFALDSVARKITRHDANDPSQILEEVTTPSASSLFLTLLSVPGSESRVPSSEGSPSENPHPPPLAPRPFLAVLDTVERQIYLYDPRTLKVKPQAAFKISEDILPLALGSEGNSILILDGKTRAIIRLGQSDKGEWRPEGVIGFELDSGPGLLSTATALLAYGHDVFLVLENDPPQIVLTRRSK
ncbi:MAG: hypothetical protein HY547_10505 [Elusimicrobia bacterium]|nr:hypothetical protein [Elusimicrobiota bacterium]